MAENNSCDETAGADQVEDHKVQSHLMLTKSRMTIGTHQYVKLVAIGHLFTRLVQYLILLVRLVSFVSFFVPLHLGFLCRWGGRRHPAD